MMGSFESRQCRVVQSPINESATNGIEPARTSPTHLTNDAIGGVHGHGRVAQGYGAIQAVRQRVEGLSGGSGTPAGETGPGNQKPGNVPQREGRSHVCAIERGVDSDLTAGTDLNVSDGPNATDRGSCCCGLMSLGMDPADIDEIIQFVDLSSPGMPASAWSSSSTNLFGPTICRRTWWRVRNYLSLR